MMITSLICVLLSTISLVHSQGVGPDSDRCMKQLLPSINACDKEIATIEKECAQGIKVIDKVCKGKDSIECAIKYLQMEVVCKNRRKAYTDKCKPLYAAHKKECTGAPVKPLSGPESDRCLKVLIAQMATCDAEVAAIDKHCNEGFKNIDKVCKGKDTVECGKRYTQFNLECKGKRDTHKSKCGIVYASYKKECTAGAPAPATGPESDLCLKQLLPEIKKCDAEIATIDKECAQGIKDIDKECKGKDSIECAMKYLQFELVCKKRRQSYTARCTPIYARHKKECTGAPVAPKTGPESDRCIKQLIPAMAICDVESANMDRFCAQGFKKIDAECKGKDTVFCGLKFTQFTAKCNERQATYKNKCAPTMAAFKKECTVKPK